MTIDLSAVVNDTAKCTVRYGGQEATLTYTPGKVTQGVMEEMDKHRDGNLRFIADVVTHWDVMLTKNKKVPLTVAGLKAVPLPFIQECVVAILSDRDDSVAEEGKP